MMHLTKTTFSFLYYLRPGQVDENAKFIFRFLSVWDCMVTGKASFTENKFIVHIFIKRIPNNKCVTEMFKFPLTSTLVGTD